jgi:hypothetical protein
VRARGEGNRWKREGRDQGCVKLSSLLRYYHPPPALGEVIKATGVTLRDAEGVDNCENDMRGLPVRGVMALVEKACCTCANPPSLPPLSQFSAATPLSDRENSSSKLR